MISNTPAVTRSRISSSKPSLVIFLSHEGHWTPAATHIWFFNTSLFISLRLAVVCSAAHSKNATSPDPCSSRYCTEFFTIAINPAVALPSPANRMISTTDSGRREENGTVGSPYVDLRPPPGARVDFGFAFFFATMITPRKSRQPGLDQPKPVTLAGPPGWREDYRADFAIRSQ